MAGQQTAGPEWPCKITAEDLVLDKKFSGDSNLSGGD
jgi:hypothetical protein